MPLFWLSDSEGKWEDSWQFIRKSGIHKSAITAKMPMTRGHSDLLVAPDNVSDNYYTQQSMGDEQCRIRLVVGLDFDDGWGANVNLLLSFVHDCQVKDHCCSTTQPQRQPQMH